MVYYNEIEPFAAAWLRSLIREGHIAPGDVDERDIRDVSPDDVRGYTQCHFFAGIGVWSYALRLAGWPDSRPVWTGSCPCQPFSVAGKRAGSSDERHLWPEWYRLLKECRPPVCFGEQVSSKDGLAWFDIVSTDMEGAGYAIGALDTCAAGVGAPHIRQRLFFVADAHDTLRWPKATGGDDANGPYTRWQEGSSNAEGCSRTGVLADAVPAGWSQGRSVPRDGPPSRRGGAGELGDTKPIRRFGRGIADNGGPDGDGTLPPERLPHRDGSAPSGIAVELADAKRRRLEVADLSIRQARQKQAASVERGASFWSTADWIPCADGKARPVEPGSFPLAHGAPARVGRLRGYGNALVAPVAAEFISAYLEAAQGAVR